MTDGKHYRVVVEHRRGRGDAPDGEQQRDREDTEKGFRRLVGGWRITFRSMFGGRGGVRKECYRASNFESFVHTILQRLIG